MGFSSISNIIESHTVSISGCRSAQIYQCKVIQLVQLIGFFIYKAKQHSTLRSKDDYLGQKLFYQTVHNFYVQFHQPMIWETLHLQWPF